MDDDFDLDQLLAIEEEAPQLERFYTVPDLNRNSTLKRGRQKREQ